MSPCSATSRSTTPSASSGTSTSRIDPGQHVLAVRAPRRRPLPARQRRRLPPLGAGAVRLRPAHARAHRQRQPHRRPPRAGGGERAGRRRGSRRAAYGRAPAPIRRRRSTRWVAGQPHGGRPPAAARPRRSPTDLGWETVATTELTIRGHGSTTCSRRLGRDRWSPRMRIFPSTALATTKTGGSRSRSGSGSPATPPISGRSASSHRRPCGSNGWSTPTSSTSDPQRGSLRRRIGAGGSRRARRVRRGCRSGRRSSRRPPRAAPRGCRRR